MFFRAMPSLWSTVSARAGRIVRDIPSGNQAAATRLAGCDEPMNYLLRRFIPVACVVQLLGAQPRRAG